MVEKAGKKWLKSFFGTILKNLVRITETEIRSLYYLSRKEGKIVPRNQCSHPEVPPIPNPFDKGFFAFFIILFTILFFDHTSIITKIYRNCAVNNGVINE